MFRTNVRPNYFFSLLFVFASSLKAFLNFITRRQPGILMFRLNKKTNVKIILRIRSFSLLLFSVVFIIYSCDKGGGGNTPPPNPCAGVTISVTGTVTNPTAPGISNGSIAASATGGNGTFTFSINGGPFQPSGTFGSLAAGSYTITAKDGNGCTGTSSTFTLVAPNPCAGVTIVVTATLVQPTTGNNNGSITASANGGAGGYTYSLNGGIFQASGTFSNLSAGTYTVTAKDVNGCTGTAVFNLVAINPCSGVTITVTGTITHPTAPGATNGSITASASGGAGGFTYNINGGTFQASGTFSNLGAGNYTISAKDANGCTGANVFTLTDPNPCAGVTITMTNAVVNNTPCQSPSGSITVTPGGGTAPYTYKLNSGSFQASNIFLNLAAGSYTITVKDANGCTGTSNANVFDLPAGPLFSAVQALIQANCVSCHNPGNPNGGMIWTVDCNIVTFKNNIKLRAVDGNPSPMPPSGLLPSSERQKITNWINAGGRYTD